MGKFSIHLAFKFSFIIIFSISLNASAECVDVSSVVNKNYQVSDTGKITPDVFDSLHLGKLGLARVAYDYALIGHKSLLSKKLLSKSNILSIIDFSLASNRKRMFVIDIKNYKLLFVTYVAHGKNSGAEKALYFSNEMESFKSSVGFYITKETYSGAHGYSLKLDGYEKGFNDKAEERAIVIHSADYVSESLIKQQGFIGRSLGCPALSSAIYKAVIEKIKNRSCLFVYGVDGKYIINSKLLKQPVKLRVKDTTSNN